MHALGVPRRAATAQCRAGRPDGYAALHGPWRRERTKHPLGLVFACAHSALLAHGAISSVGVDAYGDRDAAAHTTETHVSSQRRSTPVCLDHGAKHVASDAAALCRLLCRRRMVHEPPRTYGLGPPRRLSRSRSRDAELVACVGREYSHVVRDAWSSQNAQAGLLKPGRYLPHSAPHTSRGTTPRLRRRTAPLATALLVMSSQEGTAHIQYV